MKIKRIALASLFLSAAAAVGLASIEQLDLEKMVDRAESSIHGVITGSRVFKVASPAEGVHYFTAITIEGKSLTDATPTSIEVTVHGGFINEQEGAWNSEAPSADDLRVGNEIVAFYKWADNLGAGVASNGLYAGHGGLYRVIEGPQGKTVLGRGEGYAIARNTKVAALGQAVKTLHAAKVERQKSEKK